MSINKSGADYSDAAVCSFWESLQEINIAVALLLPPLSLNAAQRKQGVYVTLFNTYKANI